LGGNPSEFHNDDLPVENVSWDDCQEFCKKLARKESQIYRLPTEAEWEYACRAGTTTAYAFGDSLSADQANFGGNLGKTSKVGSYPANAWGLHDMHGNVREWCADWKGPYPEEDLTDPQGSITGMTMVSRHGNRVLRGGSWHSELGCCRADDRCGSEPDYRDSEVGFRVVLHRSEETGQQERELPVFRQGGEALLRPIVLDAYDRSQGHSGPDAAIFNAVCVQQHIPAARAIQIVKEEWERWWKAHPPKPPASIFSNSLDMKFAWMPPGSFLMGCPYGENGDADEKPQQKVTLTRGFWLGVHPVTQGQWKAVMGGNPSHFKGDDLPMEEVSWDDCQEFCKKLTRKDGQIYRLPTEAEWEYACRAGTRSAYAFGDSLSADQANFGENLGKTSKVGSYPANAWGLFDMHGNVLEWCADWFGRYPEFDSFGPYPQVDLIDPQNSICSGKRVLRGGSWWNHSRNCRAAIRHDHASDHRGYNVGFRVVVYRPEDS
jgi:formylglycine-generating enzyme required for sulfatase activity